jgi:predicted DsbA family dithiol-disulfide isomerase
MRAPLEVFADITCPFTHVGLKKVISLLEGLDSDVEIIVRAWPLEWVNDTPLEADAVAVKIEALQQQLGIDDFGGFREDTWPTTTIPALNLAAAASAVDAPTGLRVSLALRAALFEDGLDVSDPDVLATIAGAEGLDAPSTEPEPGVLGDYEEGQRRGVRGSPDFWVGEDEFFCPALRLGHEDGHLTAEFDADGLQRFLDRVALATP